jgi:hypothetical protein
MQIPLHEVGRAIFSDDYKERRELSEKIFNSLNETEYMVIDDDGYNIENATVKVFMVDGIKYYAYQDSANGYEILIASEYKYLNLKKEN